MSGEALTLRLVNEFLAELLVDSCVESEQYWTAALTRTRQNGIMLAAYSTADD